MKNSEKLLRRPIAEWPQSINSLRGKTAGELQEVESQLAALIQRATLLHGYISHRYNTGCGDQGHESSAKTASRQLVGVRKALGFSYPKNTPLSIQ